MSLRLIPLGTNGFIPTHGRHTMSYLVLAPDQAVLLDAGSGVARLLEEHIAALLKPHTSLDIVLSHYHLDHVIGLSYLSAAWPRPVRIHAPDRPLVNTAAQQALSELIRPPYFPMTFAQYPMPVEVVPYTGPELLIGSLRVTVRGQTHAGGSAAIRLGDDLAYCTDTVVDEATVAFVRGVKLLLHELWLDEAEAPAEEARRTGHSHAGGVVQVANDAQVGRLMVIHHHPRRSTTDVQRTVQTMQARAHMPVILPEEGRVYEIG